MVYANPFVELRPATVDRDWWTHVSFARRERAGWHARPRIRDGSRTRFEPGVAYREADEDAEEGSGQIDVGLGPERPEVVGVIWAGSDEKTGVQLPPYEWARRPDPRGGPREGTLDGERDSGEFSWDCGSEEVADPAARDPMDFQRQWTVRVEENPGPLWRFRGRRGQQQLAV